MTHSSLLRIFSYLGFRTNRKNPGTTSSAFFPALIPVVLPQRRTQLVDDRSTLPQPNRCTKADSRARLSVVASRPPMGQASSFVRGYDGAHENAERSKDGTTSAYPSNDVNDGVDSQDEQKVSADAALANEEQTAVSPEQTLTSQLDTKLETDLQASKPAATDNAKKEADIKAKTASNLVLDELGEPPERPLAGDCCGQGCDICVWDTYNDELRDYLARKKSLLAKSK